MKGGAPSPPGTSPESRLFREVMRVRATRLAAARDAEARGEPAPPPFRVRLATDQDGNPAVDLSKADPDCPRCGGTGTREPMRLDGQLVTVVCACVHRNGGVAEDSLDRMLADQTRPERARPNPRRR
jgi:hypothetical protein